jgi:hypothetical protein
MLSSCPVLDFTGGLMTSARTATSVNVSQPHPKLDHPSWTYLGRSYGAASSVGLIETTATTGNNTHVGFTYLETSYYANVSCKHEDSAPLQFVDYGIDNTLVTVHQADQFTIGNNTFKIPVYTISSAQNDPYFAWTTPYWSDNVTDPRFGLLATVATGWYSDLNSLSCRLVFAPSTFLVNVSLSSQTIKVTHWSQNVTFDPSGSLKALIFQDLDTLSRIAGNNVISELGSAILDNVRTVNGNQPTLTDGRATEVGLENSIMAIIDDLLVLRGAIQMAYYKNSAKVETTQTIAGVKVGTSTLHTVQLVVNIILLLITVVEMTRTRSWAGMPTWDYNNFGNLLAAYMRVSTGDKSELRIFGQTLPTGRTHLELLSRRETNHDWAEHTHDKPKITVIVSESRHERRQF